MLRYLAGLEEAIHRILREVMDDGEGDAFLRRANVIGRHTGLFDTRFVKDRLFPPKPKPATPSANGQHTGRIFEGLLKNVTHWLHNTKA